MTPASDEHLLGEARLPAADQDFVTNLPDRLDQTLDGCTQGAIREAHTVLTELLTNAFRHAAPPYRVRLTAQHDGLLVRIAVTDGTGRSTEPWTLRRGLHVVRELCPSWGITPDPVDGTLGKTVWAELPVLVPPRSTQDAHRRRP